jgi:ribosomal protein L11 methyltransferase
MRRLTYRRTPAAAAHDLERLVAQGFLRAAQEDDGAGPRLTCWVRSSTEERAVRALLGEPDATGHDRLDRHALDAWKVKVAPGVWLAGSIAVVPASATTVVRLPVGSGFGLGDHPTTLLAANLLARTDVRGKRVLDLGCGSGALAALAGLHGAKVIDAVDLDPDSVSHTRRTLKASGVVGKVWKSDLLKKVPGTYQVVAANLVGDLLCELFGSHTLPARVVTGGEVICSGISDAKQTAVEAAARADGWRVSARKKTAGWVGLRLRRAR